jgi:two-component system sensor histidine kinase KdpD
LPELDLETRQELGQIIVGEANRLSRVVGKLLDLSRLQAGSAAPQRVRCSIEPIISSALDQIAGGEDRFSVALDAELPEVWVDPVQAEQVFVNLFENCKRFAGEAPVRVRAQAIDGRLVVRVTDDGPGIPSGEGEREDGRPGEGSGLGLAIVKGFVEANGGRVFVESQAPGAGATFVVDLPAVAKPRAPAAARQ